MRKLVLSCDGSLSAMQNVCCAGWDGVFFEYRDGEQLRTSAAYAAREGLFIQSIHAPFEDIWRLWEDAGEGGEQELDRQIACIRATAGIGVDLVIEHAIIGMERHTPTKLGVERFGKLVNAARDAGVRIALENTEGEEYLAALMQAYGSDPTVGFCIDTGHELCYNHGQDMIGKYGKKKVFGTHLNDNMGMTGETLTWLDDAHMLPYDGVADWGNVAKRLKNAAFEGPLTFELIQGNRPERHTSDRYVALSQLDYFKLAHEHACRFAAQMERADG